MKVNRQSFLITGGNSFIGSNLIKRLLNLGAVIHALVRKGSSIKRLKDVEKDIIFHEGDLVNFNLIKNLSRKINVEYIINLARYKDLKADLSGYIKTNIVGLNNLLQCLSDFNCKHFIQFGSSTEYGKYDSPISENFALNPVNFHGVTKAVASMLCQQAYTGQKYPITVFRIFTVYGPDDLESRLIPTIINSILTQKTIKLAPGNFSRDYIYIDDLIDVVLSAINNKVAFGEIFNIGSGIQYKNEEILGFIEKIMKKKLKWIHDNNLQRPWDNPNWSAVISKAKTILGWKPRTDIESGLNKTIAWFANENK